MTLSCRRFSFCRRMAPPCRFSIYSSNQLRMFDWFIVYKLPILLMAEHFPRNNDFKKCGFQNSKNVGNYSFKVVCWTKFIWMSRNILCENDWWFVFGKISTAYKNIWIISSTNKTWNLMTTQYVFIIDCNNWNWDTIAIESNVYNWFSEPANNVPRKCKEWARATVKFRATS